MDVPTLRPALFRLPDDPIGPKVLIPGFQSATSVKGAFGWFNASWIAKLAPGLAEYLNRQDSNPIHFVVSPVFFAPEKKALENVYSMSTEEATQKVKDVFVDGRVRATALGRHALDCLSWMVATDLLRLRIAVPKVDSNYHPKMWLFDDGYHQMLARGSGNATGQGVDTGVEHLDVDITWREDSKRRVEEGVTILDDWFNGRSIGIDCVVNLPEAIEQDIIEIAPDMAPSQEDYLQAAKEDNNPQWAVDITERLRKRFSTSEPKLPRLEIPKDIKWQSGMYEYQSEAVSAWESGSKPERGIISMATGAGKTITALICATRAQDRLSNRPFLIVISAPSIPIITQWVKEVKRFGVKATVPSIEYDITLSLTNVFRGVSAGGSYVIIVSNKTLCSSKFQTTLIQKLNSGIDSMFIADEAHTLGAKGFIENTPDFFERRLALSATPERQYDPDGTEEIFSFFGRPVYNFGLDRAIGFCLSPYNYYVHVNVLSGDELDEYLEITQRVGKYIGRIPVSARGKIEDDTLTSLLIKRRSIIETAISKTELLRRVLEHRGTRSLQHALIYTSAKNPEQFENIGGVLTELNIRWASITQATTAKPNLLYQKLQAFEEGDCQVLLAKKVLDEGVDIPSIREAFILASSTVEREWIQRRGRVLRLHPDKDYAMVHDFLALPPPYIGYEYTQATRRIILTELQRALSFAKYANNASGLEGIFERVKSIRDHYWEHKGPISADTIENQVDTGTPTGGYDE